MPLTFILLYPQNAELFAFTYGALVVQLIQDYEDYSAVNTQLEKMGYSIGTRLIEDFLARSNLGRCSDFRETGEVISKVSNTLLSSNIVSITNTTVSLNAPLNKGRVQIILKYHANSSAWTSSNYWKAWCTSRFIRNNSVWPRIVFLLIIR